MPACDDQDSPSGAEGSGDRQPIGKADLVGSCADSDCNGPSSSGNCFCDDACVEFGDCCSDRPQVCGTDEGGDPCGGFAGLPCPQGQVCVDDPSDSCDPKSGGADCIGVCEDTDILECGGFLGLVCPEGLECVDFPGDDCDPQTGGADCGGMCVDVDPPTGPACGGFAGLQCPEGLTCVDDPADDCDPENGGADCAGVCVEVGTPQFCGGFGNIQCPEGLMCVDDPNDDCDPNVGADCGGICV
jgi:hypothetical protein